MPLIFSCRSAGGNSCAVSVCPLPVRQKEGTDVGHRWSRGPELGQRHDVLEGDVSLRADIHYTHVLRRAAAVMCHSSRASGGRSPENLDNDGFPPDGLHHCLLMVNFGEVACVHLEGDNTKCSSELPCEHQ